MANDFIKLTANKQSQSQIDALKKIGSKTGIDGGQIILNGGNLSIFQGDVENFKSAGLGNYNAEQLETIFGALDVDGNGQIDENEITAFAALGNDENDVIDNDKSIIDETDFAALYEMAQDYVDEALQEETTTNTTVTTPEVTTTTPEVTTTPTTTTENEVQRTEATLSDNEALAAATELRIAMKGYDVSGKGEKQVNKILLERGYNSADIVKIMNAFEEQYGESLMSDIQDDFTGDRETKLRETLYAAASAEASATMGWTSTEDIPTNIAQKASKFYEALEKGGDDDSYMKEFHELSDSEKTQIMLACDLLYPDKSAMTRITQNKYWAGYEDKYVNGILNAFTNVVNSNQVKTENKTNDNVVKNTTTLDERTTMSDNQASAVANELHTAMKGYDVFGKGEKQVNKILLERGYSSSDIVKIMDAFQSQHGESLMSDIQDDFTGDRETKLRETLYAAASAEASATMGWTSTEDIPTNIAQKASKFYEALEKGGDDDSYMKEFHELSDSEKTQIMLACDLLYPDKSAMTRITQNKYWAGYEDKYVNGILNALKNVAKNGI